MPVIKKAKEAGKRRVFFNGNNVIADGELLPITTETPQTSSN
jgi:hypothetical protein